ncbi:MAG: tRNA guanosine(34) transglycosylase Tgt [Deltaproteobacteria bacterium]|nr:tRNA guanosine(34) transglycosylase Tgt [Deltaproteobacteria bacterium]
MFGFEIIARDRKARAGTLTTPHGTVATPSFVAVGTHAAVQALSSEDLLMMGTQVIIANTYHLHLNPGEGLIKKMGGLHAFMGWPGPVVTDSGGFQIFSLGIGKEQGVGKIASIFPAPPENSSDGSGKRKSMVSVDEEGITFTSHCDGTPRRFTPEGVIHIQRRLGADIILTLDECTSPYHDYDYTRQSMERTHRWAVRGLEEFRRDDSRHQALWGVVQGGAYRDLREESAVFMKQQGFDGYAVGGSLGKTKDQMIQVVGWKTQSLPEQAPRHLLGIGEVEDMFAAVEAGIDLFDCVAPTLLARTGTVYVGKSKRFRIHIRNARFRDDQKPIEETCGCYTCSRYSRAYLRHLFMAREPFGIRLATLHNVYFMESLFRLIRTAIKEGRLERLKKEWLSVSH